MDPNELWAFLPWGYLLTVAIELPILLVGLSPRHSLRVRVTAGFWLTACTYPIVVLVLPLLIDSRATYLLVAETFAPLAECLLFYAAYIRPRVNIEPPHMPRSTWRDLAAITLANLSSFGLGELLSYLNLLG